MSENMLMTWSGALCFLLGALACDDGDAPAQQEYEAGVNAGVSMGGGEGGGVTIPQGGGQGGAPGGVVMMGGAQTAGVSVGGSQGGGVGGQGVGGVNGAVVAGGGAMMGGSEPPQGGTEEKTCEVIPEWSPSPHNGVAYVTHYGDEQLVWYRTDLEAPVEAGRIDMAGPAHDTSLDRSRHLLAVAHDVQRSVSIYQLSAPNAEGVSAPSQRATIDMSPITPRFLLFDSARARLHVIGNLPVDEELLTEMQLRTYDMSDPAAPTLLQDEAVTVPVTTTVGLDARAGVMFLIGFTDKKLYLYDVGSADIEPMPGEPLDLGALYPERNSTGMILRSIKVDPLRGRVFIARAQSANSEIIAFSYPPISGEPLEGGCPERVSYDQLTRIDDVFDLSIEPSERVNLLGAHEVHPFIGENLVLFLHDAWVSSINRPASMVTSFTENAMGVLVPQSGCEEFEDFGCFLRSYFNMTAGSYLATEGASCLDVDHRVMAVASVDPNGNDRGQVFFYQHQEDGSMLRRLSPEGSTLAAGLHPITMECD